MYKFKSEKEKRRYIFEGKQLPERMLITPLIIFNIWKQQNIEYNAQKSQLYF